MDSIKTLQQAIIHFSDFENCKKLMVELRWADGAVKCPHCGSEKVTYLAKNRVWKCYGKHPKPKFSLKTGTIFEDSPIGLEKWLPALWLVVNCKNGISSCELARDLGVTQKTAWFMAHRLRFALTEGGFGLLSGEVEVDETFIGGKARNMHVASGSARSPEPAARTRPPSSACLSAAAKSGQSVVPNRQKEDRAGRSEASMYRPVPRSTPMRCLSYRGLDGDFAHKSSIMRCNTLTARFTPTGWRTSGAC